MGKLVADEPRMFYITGLHNAHAMETQAIQLLTRQVERLEHYPELEARMRAHLDESKGDEIIKNTLANYTFEHFEIAAYKSLIAMSEFLGHPGGLAAARASLAEEEAMAAWIDERIESTTTIFLERITNGVTADH